MWPCCSPFKIFHKIFNEIASFGSVQLDQARLGSADVLNDFDAAFSRFFSLAFMQANCVSSEINKIVQLPFYILIWLNLNNADDTVQLRRQSELMLSHIRIGTYTHTYTHRLKSSQHKQHGRDYDIKLWMRMILFEEIICTANKMRSRIAHKRSLSLSEWVCVYVCKLKKNERHEYFLW